MLRTQTFVDTKFAETYRRNGRREKGNEGRDAATRGTEGWTQERTGHSDSSIPLNGGRLHCKYHIVVDYYNLSLSVFIACIGVF